jgi:hypothetical protein
MKRLRNISILLLSISGIIGLVRGYRMTWFPDSSNVLLPYGEGMIKDSIFSNYIVLGWIIFTLIGIFSVIAIAFILSKTRYYAYFIIVEGIFVAFFTLTHILFNGFSLIHLFIIPIAIVIIILGILQTPKEF